MSRQMTKRSYKNLVKEHRKKYPQTPAINLSYGPQEDLRFTSEFEKHEDKTGNRPISLTNLGNSCNSVANQKFQMIPEDEDLQTSQKISLDKRRSDALRLKRAKRRAQD